MFDYEQELRDEVAGAEAAGIRRRELGVLFSDLRVVGLSASATSQPTFGSMLNPLSILDAIQSMRHPAMRDILSGIDGVVRPGEMLLVLGRPGAGCTTLLRTLANHLYPTDALTISGSLSYSGFGPAEITHQFRGDVSYCGEDDVHFPTLTVDHTLAFAASARAPAAAARPAGVSRAGYARTLVDRLQTVLGLSHVKETLVGDAEVRGVSGGEKKRVSIAEDLAGRSVLGCWDNSTRGLDSSTALEFVRALRQQTTTQRLTTIASLYQAGEPLYALFDKVCILYEGRMAYFGPASEARRYFEDMGYVPAHRQTTADFLVTVTDPHARIQRPLPELHAPPPRTAAEFAARFAAHPLARANRADMDAFHAALSPAERKAYAASARKERDEEEWGRGGGNLVTSVPMQVRMLMLRRVQILKGAWVAVLIELSSFVILAIIVGTSYLRLKQNTEAFFSRESVIFFAYVWAGLSTMAEIPTSFAQRPIVLRQSRAALYRPFVESLALTLVDIPITFVTMVLFSFTLYFLVGFQQTAGQAMVFMLYLFTMTVAMKAWFRTLTAAFNDPAPAQAAAGVSMLFLVLYTGYPVPEPYIPRALRWISYINPLKYAYEGLMVNEFHTQNATCSSLIPSGAAYAGVSILNQACSAVGSLPGQATVSGARYALLNNGFSYRHLWRNYAIVCMFGVAFICSFLLFTELNTGTASETSVVLYARRRRRPSSSATSSLKGKAPDVVSAKDVEKGRGDSSPASAEFPIVTNQSGMVEIELSRMDRPVAQRPALPKIKGDVFSWQQLCYTVPLPGGRSRLLLEDVSGYVVPGKLTALMGESGAGKTTLLNVLSERTTGGVVTGQRFLDGQPLPLDFHARTGYCQQMDVHLSSTTVREALLFSAKLRQPQSVPLAEKEAFVDECLQMCGLEEYADAIVGTLNGELRKRTTVGVELVAKPSLIFLDEPTSGLDSQSAWAVMSFLRDLADNGLSIVCTIHQPSAELFEVFDRLLLLRKGGQTVYFGDLGEKSCKVIEYFERNGSRPCGDMENPAEFILDAIGAGATASSDIDWYEVWKQCREAQDLQMELALICKEGRTRPPIKATLTGHFATSWIYQLYALVMRDYQNRWRDPVYIIAKLGVNILCGLVLGFTYFKTKNTQQANQNKIFTIYISSFLAAPIVDQLQIPFIDMRNLYEIRERHSRMYGWTAMVTSQLLVEVPWNMVGSALFFCCWYWTVGFPTDRAGFSFLLFAVIYPIYWTAFGQAMAAMCPNAEIASLVFSSLFAFQIAFDGVLQPYKSLGWWKWMYHLSPSTYFMEGLLGQAVGKHPIVCAPVEYVNINPPSGKTCMQYMGPYISSVGGYLTNPNASSSCHYCAYSTTDQYLHTFNFSYGHHWRDFGIFFVFTLVNVIAIYLFLFLFRIQSENPLSLLRKRFVAHWRWLRQISNAHTTA
ncbi:pleiotropic drug resistance ABC transporter [Sparassis latifolia]